MGEYEISGWTPDWAFGRDQLDRHRSDLLALVGRRIVDSWLVWDLDHDEWFADLPVVLRFDGGRQLEVAWQKTDDLSITWDTIDVSTAPRAWVDSQLTWRSQGHQALRAVTGRTVTAVASSDYCIDQGRRAPRVLRRFATDATWLVRGLLLETDGVGLHVFNALDENGLTTDPVETGQDARVTPL